jgi:hypothetical protein
MTFITKIANGAIVLPPEVHLPDGTEVRVEPIVSSAAKSRRERAATLRKLAAAMPELPADLAKNHDHYIYATPRR